jgi:hypothetical protein
MENLHFSYFDDLSISSWLITILQETPENVSSDQFHEKWGSLYPFKI